MSRALLLSIKPKYVAKILNGEKTIEIRKTCPQVFKNLKPYEGCSIDVYIYCTWGTGKYHQMMKQFGEYHFNKNIGGYCGFNGKVVAKFTLNKVEEITCTNDDYDLDIYTDSIRMNELLNKSCLSVEEIARYLPIPKWVFADDRNTKIGYAWHIDNLVIFDKPKELKEFKVSKIINVTCNLTYLKSIHTIVRKPLTKAPQSWQFIESENENEIH